jgi:hypothetical protein
MSDIFEPYQRLVRLHILGHPFQVPENNLLLRQMQFLATEIGYGRFCWNGECRNCEVRYRVEPDGPERTALACRVKGTDGMELTRLSAEIKYDLGDLLRSAAAPNGEVAG